MYKEPLFENTAIPRLRSPLFDIIARMRGINTPQWPLDPVRRIDCT